MIIINYSDFRSRFAQRVVDTTASSGSVATFADTNPDRITRPSASGSYVADGFVAGMLITVTGTASNDGVYRVESVSPQVLTLSAEESLVPESVACSIVGVEMYPDGYEKWPYQNVRKPGSAFGDLGSTITGIPKPWPTFSFFAITCNGSAPDASPGVDEYDWYLSQRTEDLVAKPLIVSPVVGASGTIVIEPEASNFGKTAGDPLTPDDVVKVFKNCHLYVLRKIDGAIQWVDLLRAQVANTP